MVTEGAPQPKPLRVFLDSGVIIQGCTAPWGAANGVLILATLHLDILIVLAKAVEDEVQNAVDAKVSGLSLKEADKIRRSFAGWYSRVRIERRTFPTEEESRPLVPIVWPAVRHRNDLPAVITAVLARPDWVLSTNTEHWNERLARATGLRVATPLTFLQLLRLPLPTPV